MVHLLVASFIMKQIYIYNLICEKKYKLIKQNALLFGQMA